MLKLIFATPALLMGFLAGAFIVLLFLLPLIRGLLKTQNRLRGEIADSEMARRLLKVEEEVKEYQELYGIIPKTSTD